MKSGLPPVPAWIAAETLGEGETPAMASMSLDTSGSRKTLEQQRAGRRLASEFEQCRGERVVRAELDISVGSDDEEPSIRELAGDELKQEQRRHVGGVKVLEHEDQRALDRSTLQKRRRGVEEPEPRAL